MIVKLAAQLSKSVVAGGFDSHLCKTEKLQSDGVAIDFTRNIDKIFNFLKFNNIVM